MTKRNQVFYYHQINYASTVRSAHSVTMATTTFQKAELVAASGRMLDLLIHNKGPYSLS